VQPGWTFYEGQDAQGRHVVGSSHPGLFPGWSTSQFTTDGHTVYCITRPSVTPGERITNCSR